MNDQLRRKLEDWLTTGEDGVPVSSIESVELDSDDGRPVVTIFYLNEYGQRLFGDIGQGGIVEFLETLVETRD